MSQAQQWGDHPFVREEMIDRIPEFLRVYAERPFRENAGGMQAPHLFATWYMVQKLAPKAIVESGVFKGLGTWLLRQAAPEARLVCIDPNLEQIRYRDPAAQYLSTDFERHRWDLPRESTLLFFDDHQDALARVRVAERLGFTHLIFEDNYPAGRGDCYSLKKALMGEPVQPSGFSRLASAVPFLSSQRVAAAEYLERALDTYREFPPVAKVDKTRWGDDWDDTKYPTLEPLLAQASDDAARVFWEEANGYTWICYARLRAKGVSA